MSYRRLAWLLIGFAVLFGILTAGPALAQEIPLERCDSVPLVQVAVDGRTMYFLVDTAATSLLNLNSFVGARGHDVRITSWTGTVATSGSEVNVSEIVIGRTKLILLKLPAIDLSAIGKACGRAIDGILGADLLAKIGATIDLKRRMLHLTTAEEEHGAKLAKEMGQEMARCVTAFNHSDERSFADCFDPEVTLFTKDRTLSGRDAVTQFFNESYFHKTPAATLEISENTFHPLGEAVWFEYQLTIQSAHGLWHGWGVVLCRRSNGRLRVVHVHQMGEHFGAGVK